MQSAAEYLDHLRPWRNQDSYVTRTVLATNQGKALASRMALEIAKGQWPPHPHTGAGPEGPSAPTTHHPGGIS